MPLGTKRSTSLFHLFNKWEGHITITVFPKLTNEVKISNNPRGSKEFEYFTEVDSGIRYRPKVVARETEIAYVPRTSNCMCNVVTSRGTVSISKYTKNALRKAVRAVVVKDKRNVFLDWKTSGDLPQVYSNWKKILNWNATDKCMFAIGTTESCRGADGENAVKICTIIPKIAKK